MGDITVTAAKVAGQTDTVTRSYIAAVAITAGQAVYFLDAGTVGVADANDSGKQQFAGIALESVGVGSAVLVAHKGVVDGFSLAAASMSAFDPAYLSNTAGALSTSAGAMNVIAGKVIARSDASLTLYIDTAFNKVWS